MTRSKLKYRDVVGGGQSSKNKSSKKKVKPRKTFSSLPKKQDKSERKRKFIRDRFEGNTKRLKVEEEPEIQNQLSDSEEEGIDYGKLLRELVAKKRGKKLKDNTAIDTSDDDTSEEEQEHDDEDNQQQSQDVEKEDEELNAQQGFVHDDDDDDDVIVKENEHEQSDDGDNQQQSQDIEKEEELSAQEEVDDYDADDNEEDPFTRHIQYDLHENLLSSLQALPPKFKSEEQDWPTLGHLIVLLPDYEVTELKRTKCSILGVKKVAPPPTVPVKIEPKSIQPQDLFIKTQIIRNLPEANKSLKKGEEHFTQLQAEVFSILNNYQDILYCERTFENADELRYTYCLHAVNHILKTRLKVIHHNARLTKKLEVPDEFRDQGFVRPKILFLVPFRDAAYKIVRMITDILLPKNEPNIAHMKRFVDEFTGHEIVMPKKHPKPKDFELTFTGNSDDNFKIGMAVTRKSLKLYSDFYSSDIIIASPLGLRTIIGAKGEAERDYDFLSSIELLIMDQAEVFQMQNLLHLFHIFDHLHLQPEKSHNTDFNRIRTWSLDGFAKYYRQTVIFSSVSLPDMISIFNKKCFNHSGKVRISNEIKLGTISQCCVQLEHAFYKFEASSIQQSFDARFEFLKSKILPQFRNSLIRQPTLIYIPDYTDYVILRNYFNNEEISFAQIFEYTKENKIARARDLFFHGDKQFLLYTERFHFFNRIRVKGIRNLIFYAPPNIPHFYSEMCNFMQASMMNRRVGNVLNMAVSVIYCKYDIHQLAAIVGTERAASMIESEKKVHATKIVA